MDPPNAQDVQRPAIEASYVGNSRDIFVNGKGIERRTMSYPPNVVESYYPLKVLQTVFTSISFSNTSMVPYDNNNITVTFRSNVPVVLSCKQPIKTEIGTPRVEQNQTSQSERGNPSSLVRRLIWMRNPKVFQFRV